MSSKEEEEEEEEGNLVVFGQKVATPATEEDNDVPEPVNVNVNMRMDHSLRPSEGAFPSTGAFDDDDAFATAAASVTYGPVFEDPTAVDVRGDDDFAVGLDRNLLLTGPTNNNRGDGNDDDDDDGSTAGNLNMNMNLINTPRLWQQVLEGHGATQLQQAPEPLHELAIMAEENNNKAEDLNLLGIAPMDLSMRSHRRSVINNDINNNNNGMTRTTEENSTQNQNIPTQTGENNNNSESSADNSEDEEDIFPQTSFEEDQLQDESQTQAHQEEETEPIPLRAAMQEDYPTTQLMPDRKRNNSLLLMMENHNDNISVGGTSTYRYRYERPMFTTPLKKRRFQDLVIPAPAPLPPLQEQQQGAQEESIADVTTTAKSARQQVDQALADRQIAKEKLEELEGQWMQLKSAVETARETYQRTEQVALTTLEQLCDRLLLEDTPWNANYRLLRKFHRQVGHSNVPRRWDRQQHENHASNSKSKSKTLLQQHDLTMAEIGKLGRFVGEQRRNYRQQQQGGTRQSQGAMLLEDYQILALERLNFDWDPLQTAWQRQYQRLRRYVDEHGHTRVPCSTHRRPSLSKKNGDERTDNEDDSDNNDGVNDNHNELRSLGSWVKRQRYQYQLLQKGDPSSDMTPERIQLLNDLNFEWKLRGNTWMEYYQELKAYFLKHGNTLVPCGMKQLNEWTNEQRQQYRLYQENPALSDLSPEQANLLNGLGLAEDLREGKWYRRFQELRVFQQSHGHCIVPTKYPYNQPLVNWCATQRAQFKLLGQGKKSQLTPDRVQLLNDIGFQWAVTAKDRAEAKLRDVWEERYAECLQHHNEFGTLEGLAPDSPLHRWWREQRQHHWNFKSGKPSPLSPEQINQLERLGISRGNTSVIDDEAISSSESCWEGLYGDLLMYRLNHGTFSIPETDNYKTLHEFVKKQRRDYLKFKRGVPSSLNEHRVRKLDRVGFPWKSTDGKKATRIQPTWEEMFGELLAFRLNYNSFDVSREYNGRLHDWIEDQKQLYRCFGNQSIQFDSDDSMSTSLLRKRYEKLEDISFPWD